MPDSHEQHIKRALQMLERCGADGAAATNGDDESESGEILLQGLDFLLNSHLEAQSRFERLQKELEIIREVNADANAMLEQKIEEISLLRLITDTSSRAMQTQDPLKLIVGKVVASVGAESGSIMLQSSDSEHLEIRAASGPEGLGPEHSLSGLAEKVAARAMASGEPHFIDDISAGPADPASPPEQEREPGSLASFPLMIENRTIGVINLNSPHPNAFGAETQRIMHIIAGQIAVAVENARLYGEVRKTKEYLENLVEKAGDAIFTLDRAHRIVSWNKGAETIFNLDRQGVVGKTLYEMVPEGMEPTLREKIQSILDSENIVTIDTDLEYDQSTRITITLSPIRGADGEVAGVSGIAKDITKHRQLEDQLRQLNEAKSNFVATVSHELRTPLTSIKSMTEVLSHELATLPKESIMRYLNIINEECDRLSGLISGLLDLQKLNAGKLDVQFKKVRLADIVRHVAGLFDGVALQNRIELTSDFAVADHMTTVRGDRGQLMRVLSNLLSNAVKYSVAGNRINIRLFREDGDVGLAVIDNGIGIAADLREKVFEKFYQVNNPATRSKGGTGLGLAITKELVSLHGGRIWVEDADDGGCCFKVFIPAVEQVAEESAQPT